MYGTDPFSAQHATDDVAAARPPSVFGALPYPASQTAHSLAGPSLRSLVTFRFASLSPSSVLDCRVVGPNGETCYRVATGGQAYTLLKDGAGRNVALVRWETRPTVEAQALVAKQAVGQWLRLSADKSVRTMAHGGACYSWAPLGRFLHLSAPGSSEWLARVTKTVDAVLLELTPRAIELDLIDAAVLATLLLMSGKTID